MFSKQIHTVLKKEGLLSKQAASDFKEYERNRYGNILDYCTERNVMPVTELMRILQQQYGIPVVDLSATYIDAATVKLLPASVVQNQLVLPFYQDEQFVYVATAYQDQHDLFSFITKKTGKRVSVYLAHQQAIKRVAEEIFNGSAKDNEVTIADLIKRAEHFIPESSETTQDAFIISLLDQLIVFAVRSNVSDMHIEPREERLVIRFRIDGLLHEFFTMPKRLLAPLTARVKILAQLRIDEAMRPQDGRFNFKEIGCDIAVRVSIVPTLHGPKTTMRFLDTRNENISLDTLGLYPQHRSDIERLLKASSGLILVSGPTGSGKTTTMYAMIKAIMREKVNISTIEDPIEYHLKGANQVQVNPQADLNFAEGLRALLRQDPDIIMVGEIRDRETAMIAVNAALTGHLVISSIHTNYAAAAIPRLLDMGIEPYLLASTLRAIVSQRLVRKICRTCASRMHDVRLAGPALGIAPAICPDCFGTGYLGRTAIFEMLPVDESIHQLIVSRADAKTIDARAKSAGMQSMEADGLHKVADGITTREEIARVLE